jgi:hypothetical protein
MKNPMPDKRFFHFFEKILNGQTGDLSLCDCPFVASPGPFARKISVTAAGLAAASGR